MTDGIKGGNKEQEHEVNQEHPDEVYEERSRVEHHEEPEGARYERTERRRREPRYETTREEYPERRERRDEESGDTSSAIGAGGSSIEAIAGAGAVVLAILGLIEMMPQLMLTIGTIAAGVGLMFGGASIGAKYREAVSAGESSGMAKAGLGGGMSTEIIGGAAGAVLGLLALLDVADPNVLIPAAVIALGGAILFGAGATSRMRNVTLRGRGSRESRQFASESISAAASTQVFIGIGVATLGIVALAGIASPMTLSLVAILALGSSMLISGAALGGRMMQQFAY